MRPKGLTLVVLPRRAGEGEFLLLGKVDRADPREGVAQLINDHSAIRAPSKVAATAGDGVLRSSDVDGLILKDPSWPYPPVAIDGSALRSAVAAYVGNIETGTNCALVQARTGMGTGINAPRARPRPRFVSFRFAARRHVARRPH